MTTLHLPKGLNYHCIQCGKSCRMFHEVGVEQRSEKTLRELDFRPLMAKETRELDPLVESPTTQGKKILRRHCGTCVFQRDDGLCAIHAKFDYFSKPQTCRDFPFRYVETEEGGWVGLSFACTAVLHNEGPAVENQRDELEQSRPHSNARRTHNGPVRITHRHEISWDAYLAIEEDLDAILALPGRPLGAALAAQAVYLDLLARLFREMRGDSPGATRGGAPITRFPSGRFPPDHGPLTDIQVLASFRKRYMEKSAEPLFHLFEKAPPSPALQRAFLGLMTAFRRSFHDARHTPSRAAAMLHLVRHYTASVAKIGKISLDDLDKQLTWNDFSSLAKSPEENPENRELLLRYFRHFLFRKDLLLADSVWLGQRLALMNFALLRWYAAGFATQRHLENPDLECFHEAIRAIELHYVFHTRFQELFERMPILASVLNSTVSRPAYAASMIAAP